MNAAIFVLEATDGPTAFKFKHVILPGIIMSPNSGVAGELPKTNNRVFKSVLGVISCVFAIG